MVCNRILIALLVVAMGCHRGHYQAVRVQRCDGDNALLISNASNTAVDIYFSAAGSKTSDFLGEAAVGDTELPLPPMFTNQGYRFEARRRDATPKTGRHISAPATRVTFRTICHPR